MSLNKMLSAIGIMNNSHHHHNGGAGGGVHHHLGKQQHHQPLNHNSEPEDYMRWVEEYRLNSPNKMLLQNSVAAAIPELGLTKWMPLSMAGQLDRINDIVATSLAQVTTVDLEDIHYFLSLVTSHSNSSFPMTVRSLITPEIKRLMDQMNILKQITNMDNDEKDKFLNVLSIFNTYDGSYTDKGENGEFEGLLSSLQKELVANDMLVSGGPLSDLRDPIQIYLADIIPKVDAIASVNLLLQEMSDLISPLIDGEIPICILAYLVEFKMIVGMKFTDVIQRDLLSIEDAGAEIVEMSKKYAAMVNNVVKMYPGIDTDLVYGGVMTVAFISQGLVDQQAAMYQFATLLCPYAQDVVLQLDEDEFKRLSSGHSNDTQMLATMLMELKKLITLYRDWSSKVGIPTELFSLEDFVKLSREINPNVNILGEVTRKEGYGYKPYQYRAAYGY